MCQISQKFLIQKIILLTINNIMGMAQQFKRKITNADHYLFGQTKTYGTTLNFTDFPFLIYIIKAIKEMAVCIVALDCVQNDENLELTALNGWRRHTQSNMSI